MAIPKPNPRDYTRANAQELAATDREVLAMLRDASKAVNKELADLVARDSGLISDGVRRAQLEQSRARLLARQAQVFERLGDIIAARRARAAVRAQRLSVAADAALLALVGKGAEAQYLYEAALKASDRAIDAALARMKLSALPLAQRLYKSQLWMDGRLGKLINETLASGLNARTFAKKARDWFNPNTPGGIRYAAMRLARTEINNSFHAMSAAKYADTPWIEEVDWNLSGSHPVPDECNPLAEASPYPSDEVPVRPHPQCMCNITSRSIDEGKFVENFLKGDYDEYLDNELEEKGWDVKESKPRPEGVPKSETARTNPASPNEAEFTSLKVAGLDAIGSEFIYHGDARKDYRIVGRRVRVAPPVTPGGANARALIDVETGALIGQQASNSAKWWIEKLPADRFTEAATGEDALLAATFGLDRKLGGKGYRPGMTPEMRQGVSRYTSTLYRVINAILRGGKTYADEEELQRSRDAIPAIDAAFEGSSVDKDVLTYRAIHSANLLFGDRFDHDLTGMEWKEEAYVSTTADIRKTRVFRGGGDKKVLMRILVPQGTPAIEASGMKLEAELLLARGTNLRIVKDNGFDAEGVRQLDVEVVLNG